MAKFRAWKLSPNRVICSASRRALKAAPPRPAGRGTLGGLALTNDAHAISPGSAIRATRPVGVLLLVGVVLAPYIFAWVLLGRGYSARSRFAAFAWMALCSSILVADLNRGFAGTHSTPIGATDTHSAAGAGELSTAAFRAGNTKVLAGILPCQLAVRSVAASVHKGDQFGAYDQATQAKQACANAALDLNDGPFSDAINEPARARLNAAAKECGQALADQFAAMDATAKVMNGDTRPSAVGDAGRQIRMGQARMDSCMADYATAVKAGGFMPTTAKSKSRRRHPA
jgi:hypothetical protein